MKLSNVLLIVILCNGCFSKKNTYYRSERINESGLERFIDSSIKSKNYLSGAYFYRGNSDTGKENTIWIFDHIFLFKKDTVRVFNIKAKSGQIYEIESQPFPFQYDSLRLFDPISEIHYEKKIDSIRFSEHPWGDDTIHFILLTETSKRSTEFCAYLCRPNMSKPHPLCELFRFLH